MQGGGGDPFNFNCPSDGFGGSSGGPNNGPPSLMSSFGGDSFDGFGAPNNEHPSHMSNVLGGDSADSFGGSNNGPPSQMSNVLGGVSVDGFGGSFGGSNGDPPSLMSSFFGGRDPFDDPFFTEPFGGSMFHPSLFGPPTVDPFAGVLPPPLGFIENHHHQTPQPRLPGGPVIEEINVLDAEEEGEAYQEKSVILGKRGRSSSEVETEEAIAEERRITHMQNMNANAMVDNGQWQQQTQERRITHMQNMNANAMVNSGQWQPQTQGYSFQSSTVTYGGNDGNYYTSSTNRRTGSDGLTLEESKEANTATREAAHRISRGFHNKGHTVERTRNSDGRIGTNQILHNLNEEEGMQRI
ncbi:uncharacterized protein LOC106376543 isoform X1 [Brassica napus]|uniref:uncharacterized protein LOC106376543 isoform X1 n=1 Tax=Brassica napus TaxID=3708 RepID=UPI0020786672|nr:uncharacterized protein LOC106376543 isoform X1 [Brassica napus]XP_048601598.1 uncharacterized protein LOC106376543 isoform X1 [Brassica napus]